VVKDSLEAPADVDLAGVDLAGVDLAGVGFLHIVVLVPGCGKIVTRGGGAGLEAGVPAGLAVAGPLVPGAGVVAFPAGAGVSGPLVAGAGVVVFPAGAGVGACVWGDTAVGPDVAAAGCGVPAWLGDVPAWLGDVLAVGISGLAGMHEAPGDGWAAVPGALPFGLGVPSWPLLPAGCPLPVLVSVPLGPAAGGVPPDTDDAMVTIACRTPGTASAVPAKKTTAARASTGRSQTVPARCQTVPAWCQTAWTPFAVAAAARRPAEAAAAATASA
jgi:hypothetical protein